MCSRMESCKFRFSKIQILHAQTLLTVSREPKSLPPVSLKPHGPPPSSRILISGSAIVINETTASNKPKVWPKFRFKRTQTFPSDEEGLLDDYSDSGGPTLLLVNKTIDRLAPWDWIKTSLTRLIGKHAEYLRYSIQLILT